MVYELAERRPEKFNSLFFDAEYLKENEKSSENARFAAEFHPNVCAPLLDAFGRQLERILDTAVRSGNFATVSDCTSTALEMLDLAATRPEDDISVHYLLRLTSRIARKANASGLGMAQLATVRLVPQARVRWGKVQHTVHGQV